MAYLEGYGVYSGCGKSREIRQYGISTSYVVILVVEQPCTEKIYQFTSCGFRRSLSSDNGQIVFAVLNMTRRPLPQVLCFGNVWVKGFEPAPVMNRPSPGMWGCSIVKLRSPRSSIAAE